MRGKKRKSGLHGVLSAVPTKPPIAPEIKSLRSWAVLLCTLPTPKVNAKKIEASQSLASGRDLAKPL